MSAKETSDGSNIYQFPGVSPLVTKMPPALKVGGGGGTSDGMEGRIASLEAHMEHVREDVGALKTDVGLMKISVATLVERVSHLPTKGFMVASVIATLTVIAGLVTFAHEIRSLVGLP